MNSEMGKVWLVGAGPGDIGLLTIKGKQVLEKAEVVVYDRLVGREILAVIPREAECIDVGKRAGNHTMPQDDINRLLVEKALEGKKVVRLKGGDPFLFGRGGEELELLCEHHIPYEIVPGITSAIAVPSYNGIPVTHRDHASSVHIITGHKKEGQEYDIDFEALVRAKGTLIFLMGISTLVDICDGLLNAGMERDMPAAVLQQGTTAAQKRVVATVGTLGQEARRQGIKAPAIIVVGKVCELSDAFAWRQKLPLAGRKIVVTRPRELASDMAEKLRNEGAEVLECPSILTKAAENQSLLHKCIEQIEKYRWIAFTSRVGVKIFFAELMRVGKDSRCLGTIKIAAIGEGTRKALKESGILADLVPEVYDGEHLGRAIVEEISRNFSGDCRNQGCDGEWAETKILLPRAHMGSQELYRVLTEAGMQVDDVPIYDTFYERQSLIDIKTEIESKNIDFITFTSASTVRGFVEATKGLDYTNVKAVCIGRQTASEAGKYGMECHIAENATIDSVVEKIIELCI